MARYWQRRARLIRGAMPAFRDVVSLAELQRLAARDDVESRVVVREGKRWRLEHGPFPRRFWKNMPTKRWTLLVQGLNQVVPGADALLQRFAFIPYARLDDVMVSYAAPGGGVGPHVDSYDVFLLQGMGIREWRISTQKDHALDPQAPLKILRAFRPQQTWQLTTGDMLYLPPHVAHDGVAIEPCTTYSIGFRAPRYAELFEELFADHALTDAGAYTDPGLCPTKHPGALPTAMIEGLAGALSRLRFSRKMLGDVIGTVSTTPKANVIFERPVAPLPKHRFAASAQAHGVRLDPRSIMLYFGTTAYINSEQVALPARGRSALCRLADERRLTAVPASVIELLYEWYCAGWLHLIHDPT
jgi:50S ribosomal protein L16 3-hydroxylase